MQDRFLGYTGAYGDAVTGSYPLGNGYRVYLPWSMRFSAPDSWSPFGRGGINPYTYCNADPINRSDPTGHMDINEGEIVEALHSVESESIAARETTGHMKMETPAVVGGPDHLQRGASGRSNRMSSSDLEFNLDEETWAEEMLRDNVIQVHGSNSASFEGVVKFGGLLPMEEMHANPWFFRNGDTLPSGEFVNTVDALKRGDVMSRGISMSGIHDAPDSVAYSWYLTSESVFPALYGMGSRTKLVDSSDHLLSQGKIGIEDILAVYVPKNRVSEAKRLLLEYGNETLSSRVRGSDIFDRYGRVFP